MHRFITIVPLAFWIGVLVVLAMLAWLGTNGVLIAGALMLFFAVMT